MQPASSGAKALRMKAAIGAVETTEEIMRLLARSELVRYTHEELADALKRNLDAVRELPEGSIERENANANVENVRRELFRRTLMPRGFSR